MLVYLKCDYLMKKIPNVTLKDCYIPMVEDFVEERIDPALWYKVLVLNAVFVDCDQRSVFWSIRDDEQSCAIFEDKIENLSTDRIIAFFHAEEKLMAEDCYDFDPSIDELFDTARNVFYAWQTTDQLGSQEDLLKMLHVYILPKVQFTKCHIDLVRDVLGLIEIQHEDIEDKIQKKDMTKKNVENSLRKQRERILKNEDFSRTSYISTLSEKFLNVFLQHLEKDIRKLNEDFVSRGCEVEQLRDSIKRTEIERFSDYRSDRDRIYEDLKGAIAAREEIKNVISRNHLKKVKKKKSKRRSSHTVFHEVYMEVTSRLQGMSKDIQGFINIKIKLSSVREAVLLSVKELETDGQTVGFNRKKGSFEMEADLYDPHNKPDEWSTLEEKVKLILSAKQMGVRKKYEKFCAMIKDKCQRLFDESKLFTISEVLGETPPLSPGTKHRLTIASQASLFRRSSHNRHDVQSSEQEPQHGCRRFATTYTSRWSFGSIPKESCEGICHDIIEHLTAIAKELAVELKHNEAEIPRSFVCKVYICYEEHVSSKLMPVLNELYECSYKDKCDSLAKWIASTPMSEFEFGQNIMASFLQLVSSGSSSETGSREPSTEIKPLMEDLDVPDPQANRVNTLGNQSIRDLTLEQLYGLSDPDLPPMYNGLMDDDGACSSDGCPEDNSEANSVKGLNNEPSAENSEDQFDASQTHPKVLCGADNPANQNKFVASGVEIGVSGDTLLHQVPTVGQGKDSGADQTHPKVYVTEDQLIQSKAGSNGVEIGVECGSIVRSDSFEVILDSTEKEILLCQQEEVVLRPKPQNAVSKPALRSVLMPLDMEQLYEHFKDFEKFLHEEDEACTLFRKLRTLTKALKYIESQISNIRKGTGVEVQVCSDDLLDIIIMLLCRIKPEMLLKLYSHMNLLLHLRPNFMEGSAHDYALITFCGAFQHLFEQKVLSNA